MTYTYAPGPKTKQMQREGGESI